MKLKYAIVGVGAIGGYYGAKLAKYGNDVHFLHNSDYNYVKENGLVVESKDGDFKLINSEYKAYKSVKDMPKVDVVLVGLKTTKNYLLAEILPQLVSNNTITILIQNGIGLEEKLNKELPNLNIAGAIAFIGSTKIGKGHIKHTDNGKLELASYNIKNHLLLEQVTSDLNKAEIPTKISNNLALIRWKKLLWNVAFNGPSVLLNATTDKIVNNISSAKFAEDLMHEVILGAKACGVYIDESMVGQMMELTRRMSDYSPSMKLDYENNRPMEIEAIYSLPIQYAKENGFEMKKLEVIESMLQYLEQTKN